MSLQKLIDSTKQAIENPDCLLPETEFSGELGELALLFNQLLQENNSLRENNQKGVDYLRRKINQLLQVIGTIPLRAEELDDKTLISLDPIGIIAESFTQILDHLRQTNEKLELAMVEIQAIFEAVGGGVLVLGPDKKIISCNNRLLKMFMGEHSDVRGKSCSELICHETLCKACAFDKMMLTGNLSSTNERLRNEHHYNVAASPVKNKKGEVVRAVLLYTDVTELFETKAIVAEEKERLSLTLESIAEGVIATDEDSKITLMNKSAEKLTGWPIVEALGQHVCNIFNIHEGKDKISCKDILLKNKKDNENHKVDRMGNSIMQARDGSELLINLSASPIRRQDQLTSGTILVFRDITHEKKLEEEIIKSSKIESLGILAGGIAHDFNNLLTAIIGNISLAKTYVEPNETLFNLLEETEKSSLQAKNLTQQLLTFAKGGEPVTEVASVNQLIIESAKFSSRGSKLKCEFSLPDDLWPAQIDKGQIGQVIQNLVINADQAMSDSGTVYIRSENIIHKNTSNLPLAEGRYIKISVKDCGHGIENEVLNKIFDPYFTTKDRGNGLGLTICYSIVKKHQGHITVASELGSCTTFTIYLPASGEQIETENFATEKLITGQGRILVMDDEPLIRNISVQLINHLGYEVDVCCDGQEAIDLYTKSKNAGAPYDAVIMDLTIPGGKGGKEAIAELLAIDPEVKAIVSSGYANDPIMANPRAYGFKGVIPKPYCLNELGKMLQIVLENDN